MPHFFICTSPHTIPTKEPPPPPPYQPHPTPSITKLHAVPLWPYLNTWWEFQAHFHGPIYVGVTQVIHNSSWPGFLKAYLSCISMVRLHPVIGIPPACTMDEAWSRVVFHPMASTRRVWRWGVAKTGICVRLWLSALRKPWTWTPVRIKDMSVEKLFPTDLILRSGAILSAGKSRSPGFSSTLEV